MKFLLGIILLGSPLSVLACKSAPLSGSKRFMKAVIENVGTEEIEDQDFSIDKIEVIKFDFHVTLKKGNVFKKYIYKVAGKSDCSVKVSKVK